MTYKNFYTLFSDALESNDRDAFASDWATSSLFDDGGEQGTDLDALLPDLYNIWDVAHKSIKDIRKATGLTQVAFAERFCVGRRTVQNWELREVCPNHTRLMMANEIGLLTVARGD